MTRYFGTEGIFTVSLCDEDVQSESFVRIRNALAQIGRRKRAQIADDLPSLLLRKRIPGWHTFVGVAVAEHPCQVPVAGVADAGTAQAGAVGPSVGVGAVAFCAVVCKELLACSLGLELMGERISAGVVFIGDAMKPFAVELTALRGMQTSNATQDAGAEND